MKTSIAKLLTFTLFFAAASAQAKDLHFGDAVDKNKLIKISTLMEKPDDYLSSPVTIEGTVVGVCQKRGCWMSIASDKRFQNLRIKVNDGDMVFPMTAKGSKAFATGMLTKNQLTLSESKRLLAHRAQKNGEAFDEASVKQAIATYQLVPTGVTILD